MKRNILYLVLLLAICSTVSAQTHHLKINSDIVMPEDSLECNALLFSINAFLASAEDNSPNNWILPTEIVETQILIDEILDIQKSEEFENDSFYKAYLTNIIPLEDDSYSVKIAYSGINDSSVMLRASFELIAHKTTGGFMISSPLIRNTKNWKTKKIQNHIFHYPYTIDEERMQIFADKTVFYDDLLKNNTGESHYYLCKDESNPLSLFGVAYKSDYNGDQLYTRWESKLDKKTLWVANESRIYDYDLHDLWHNRLGQIISRKKVHRRVDCHIACLYGGCWGASWEELFPVFNREFVVGKDVDWLAHKKNSSHIVANGHKVYTDDFAGALLIQKIEKEKGFDGVWQLLMTKRTKEEKEYFSALENLTGITKTTYNKEVSKLIEEEVKVLGI